MKRLGKWLLPLLILLNIALVRADIFAVRDVIVVTIALDGLLWLVAGRHLFVAWQQYRRDRRADFAPGAALERALATVLPQPVAHLFALEARLWTTLIRWLARRGPSGPAVFPYARRSPLGLLVGFVALTTPLELLLWELLIPWTWLRVALFVLGIYGLAWVVGLYASLRIYPHELGDRSLRVHHGLLATAWIPYEAIGAIEIEQRSAPKQNEGVQIVRSDRETGGASTPVAAFVAVGGKTDVTLALTHPLTIERLFGPSAPVTTIHLAVDDPAGFVAAVERARAGMPPPQERLAAALAPG